MNELVKRSVFGLLYVGLMLAAVLVESSWLSILVFSLLGFVGVCEYSELAGLHRTRSLRVILDGLAVVYLIILGSKGVLAIFFLTPYLLYIAYIIVRSMYSKPTGQPEEIAKIIFGQLYIGLPLAIASYLASSSPSNYILLMMFLCIWANDTGAFIVGSRIGKRRLFPSLSPKKSWEGFFGGMLFSVVTAVLCYTFLFKDEMTFSSSGILSFVLLGIIISAFATWGDLFESMLKRNAGVKDSGSIIPGHGGVLDRIDSILFVVPCATIALVF